MQLSEFVTLERTELGLEYMHVKSPLCEAKIFLQGAQLTAFTPKGKNNLIWVSEEEDYQVGKPIRGGIPVCWPWFGVHPDPEWPIHGFARRQIWRAGEILENEGVVTIRLSLPKACIDTSYWPHDTQVSIEFILSEQLHVNLNNHNLSSENITFTQALHTYFPTPNIKETFVDGLQNSKFIEFGEGPFAQSEVVGFQRETDMVYTQAAPVQVIKTPNGDIEVSRENSHSCVLWNPWIKKSEGLSNFANTEYKYMVCLESANVLEDAVTLAPNETHTLGMTIRWI